MRLNAFLARSGVASRRGADELIKAGRVTVNGEVAGLATFVESRDIVEVDGERVRLEPLTYVLLHKPAGVVTTAKDPQGRPTVVELVTHENRVVPVGRLDVDTTGALLLTNDGQLAHRLMHPRYEVDKVYEADVEGEPTDAEIARLIAGVDLEDGGTAPAGVRRLGPSRLELTLHEGRKHQVKRMCEAVGHPVVRLHRSVYAGLTVDGLAAGGVARADPRRSRRPRLEPVARPGRAEHAADLGADDAHVVEHRVQRRLGHLPRLLGADRQQPLQLARVGAQLAVPLLDRREQLDDRLADGLLERAVALPVELGLDVLHRLAGRDRHDLDEVRDARLVVGRGGSPSPSR